ncbi:MAG: Sec-independent protein translocase protein TatB [Desulfocapsa sp.]|nr:Sec-independent protein translocase protein TatB [Desulfocapsa sp.]
MFGIGLPELIVILALALIVVGPDKLPDLARSVAKGILELKKTANTLKESLTEEGNPLDEIKPELEEAAKAIKDDILSTTDDSWKSSNQGKTYDPRESSSAIIDVKPEQPTTEAESQVPPTADKKESPETRAQQS